MPSHRNSLRPKKSPAADRRRCWAIILAGGSGKRLGMDRPKAFVPLAGRPLLAWSILAFVRHKEVTDVLVVVPRGYREEFHRAVLGPLEKELGDLAQKIHTPVIGGRHRQESAQAGLMAALQCTCEEDAECTPVLIHDSARPVVRPEVISDLLAQLRTAHEAEPGVKGAAPVLSVGDTIKIVKGAEAMGALGAGRVVRTIPRDELWQVQTPQAFCLGPIVEAHREAVRADFRATDDAMLFEWMDWPVAAIHGSPLTMKVTEPEDLSLLDGWLSVRSGVEMPTRPCDGRRRRARRQAARVSAAAATPKKGIRGG